ncbi:prolipoprotein diacylglyceryl transferase [Gordonia zhaorongruii]|uniref:prolipoprotein diacylglyceryl transferase n=1 Tax=Gordonia zhaorongruii TaxID=2597659 RepID=UPI00104E70DC|nr:prolipoprotein diacylglyceryl transferase [Gordonia zhaorongruii]
MTAGEVLAYIPSPSQGVWHLGPFPLRAYALCIILGIVVAVWWGDRRWQARGGRPGDVLDVGLIAVPFGLVGGRIYHVMTDWWRYFGENGKGLGAVFQVWDGGLGIWGAVAFGAVGAWLGCRWKGIKLPSFGDAIAPAILLAQAIGRLGNYFNQELYGRPTTVPWGLELYERVNPDTGRRGIAVIDGTSNGTVLEVVHPTFLYELVWSVLIVGLLVVLDRKFRLGHGRLFALYVAGYCVGRFIVELMRSDEATHILGLRVNVIVAALVFVCAALYVVMAPRGRETGLSMYWPYRAEQLADEGEVGYVPEYDDDSSGYEEFAEYDESSEDDDFSEYGPSDQDDDRGTDGDDSTGAGIGAGAVAATAGVAGAGATAAAVAGDDDEDTDDHTDEDTVTDEDRDAEVSHPDAPVESAAESTDDAETASEAEAEAETEVESDGDEAEVESDGDEAEVESDGDEAEVESDGDETESDGDEAESDGDEADGDEMLSDEPAEPAPEDSLEDGEESGDGEESEAGGESARVDEPEAGAVPEEETPEPEFEVAESADTLFAPDVPAAGYSVESEDHGYDELTVVEESQAGEAGSIEIRETAGDSANADDRVDADGAADGADSAETDTL